MFQSNSIVGLLFCSALAIGCGGKDHHVLTPDERLERELAEAERQDAERSKYDRSYGDYEADSEANEKFDKENADHEVRRASLGAADCPNALPEEEKKKFRPGTATIQIVLTNDGAVKEVVVDPTYADSPVGSCLERAFEGVRIKPFVGAEETVEWKVELKLTSDKGEKDKKAPAKK